MAALTKVRDSVWLCAGKCSKDGHPHHPLYLKRDEELHLFDIENYLQKFWRKLVIIWKELWSYTGKWGQSHKGTVPECADNWMNEKTSERDDTFNNNSLSLCCWVWSENWWIIKKKAICPTGYIFCGPGWVRTSDQAVMSRLLWPLSYGPERLYDYKP